MMLPSLVLALMMLPSLVLALLMLSGILSHHAMRFWTQAWQRYVPRRLDASAAHTVAAFMLRFDCATWHVRLQLPACCLPRHGGHIDSKHRALLLDHRDGACAAIDTGAVTAGQHGDGRAADGGFCWRGCQGHNKDGRCDDNQFVCDHRGRCLDQDRGREVDHAPQAVDDLVLPHEIMQKIRMLMRGVVHDQSVRCLVLQHQKRFLHWHQLVLSRQHYQGTCRQEFRPEVQGRPIKVSAHAGCMVDVPCNEPRDWAADARSVHKVLD
mmetsp:Transcript_22429/g.38329  ORF Transcript_22429/g.38329 Transcript_22429/m.38329 type:complete len:267 (+) Transcript_22429:388-1188(+)